MGMFRARVELDSAEFGEIGKRLGDWAFTSGAPVAPPTAQPVARREKWGPLVILAGCHRFAAGSGIAGQGRSRRNLVLGNRRSAVGVAPPQCRLCYVLTSAGWNGA